MGTQRLVGQSVCGIPGPASGRVRPVPDPMGGTDYPAVVPTVLASHVLRLASSWSAGRST